MALDGRGHLSISHNRPAPKPGEVEHGSKQAATVEEDMVVMLHA